MAAAEAVEPWKSREWLEDRYHGDGASASELARECGVTSSTVSYWMAKLGVEPRSDGRGRPAHRPEDAEYKDRDWLEERHWGRGRTIADMADEAGVSYATIYHWMDKLGVETRPVGGRIPDGDLVEDVERVGGEVGLPPRRREYIRLGEYNHETVETRFGDGSWGRAMRAIFFEDQ